MIPFLKPAYSHGEVVETAGVAVRLNVNPRARRVSLRLDRTSGEVIATAPSPRKLSDAVAFAKARAGWIAARVAEQPDRTALEPGLEFEVFGEPVVLAAGAGRARLKDGVLTSADDAAFEVRVVRILKTEALRVLTERTAYYAERLGQPIPKVAVADPRGRWGSCKQASVREPASIRYSWRLALAPFAVADYVVAHECAHLVEANHGPRFWALVGDLVGDHRPHRDWLKRESRRLHTFGR
jgi:predicted metal-dependent hydrolase